MTLSIIVAMSKNHVIGRDGKLPWHMPEDFKRFKQITLGHPIIMGRKTFESIGHPLPGRQNIVVTHNQNFKVEGTTICHSFDEALEACGERDSFVIGGAEIFAEALPFADKIYLTLIEKNMEGDTFFPENGLENDFDVIERSEPVISLKDKIPYRFIVMARKLPSAA